MNPRSDGTAGKLVRAGTRLGKYRILGKVAEGGFTTVYRARDTVLEVQVALKLPGRHAGDEVVDLMKAEARIHAKLEHPNILPLKNADWFDGVFGIAYPLGEQCLADRLQYRIATATCVHFVRQMVDALAYAHEHRVLHCDVKPENFILFPDHHLCLSDFGISRLIRHTIRGSGAGTLGYMAPEQAMGRASFRGDVFSLGLVLYRLFAGVLPEWPFEWPFPGHANLRRRAHPDLVRWLRRALEVEPRRRFANAIAMRDAFDEIEPVLERWLSRRSKERRRQAR